MKQVHWSRTVRNDSGFTIIELMVVVGILSVLSQVALPMFVKYQARARTAEARIMLSSVYTFEKTFHTEQNSFTTCLSDAGFGRTGQAHYYAIGFVNTATNCGSGGEDCHLRNFQSQSPLVCTAGAFPAGGYFPASKSSDGRPVSRAEFSGIAPTQVSRAQFLIAAVGRVGGGSNRNFDVWVIDDNKNIVQRIPGL